MTSTKSLLQLATHIPDTVIRRSPNAPIPDTHNSHGVVMFLDISGFTALCERYCSTSLSKKKGTDQLTSTLNSYLSKIVQTIMINSGDVLKFAGDALLAYWPCGRLEASRTLQYVLQDSLAMQSEYDNFETPDGVILRMKIAISVGKCHIHYIGNESYKTFDITGAAIDDVNVAQSYTKPGAVVVSKTAWTICDQERYAAKGVEEGCVQISKIVKEGGIDLPRKETNTTPKLEEEQFELTFRKGIQELLIKMPEEVHSNLKSFTLKTVVQKIDHGIDVSWLSELRQVSVLFINLDPDSSISKDLLVRGNRELELLQTAFQAVYPSLVKFDGTLNKVFMFDKGCTFLCIFGLPHASHEDDPSRAVRAAQSIFFSLKQMKVNHCSIGVTTGIAFCGVVGHPERQEYTVIGEKVNMAARLMTNFPDAVTCDKSTRSKTDITSNQFSVTPSIKLKGISNPEKTYFVRTDSTTDIDKSDNDIDLLDDEVQRIIGREKEMKLFLSKLHNVTEETQKKPRVIVLCGEGGIGKTKLLKAMKAKALDMGFRVMSGFGGLIEQNTPFFTVKTLLVRLLELDTCTTIHKKEQLLLQHVNDEEMREHLPLLNDLLVVKFPQTCSTLQMSYSERMKNLHKLLLNIVHQEALSKPCVFGIDDAHWMDKDSWAFILDLASSPNSILVLATRPINEKNTKKWIQQIKNLPATCWIDLKNLASNDMVDIACQMLQVDEIDDWLVEVIASRSHGIPLWCEELVKGMQEMKAIEIIEITDEEKGTKHKRCIINESVGLYNIPVQDSISGMVLTRIDNMSPLEQMVVKCASIIGTSFHLDLLRAILPTNSDLQSLRESLNTLAECKIIECSVAAAVRNRLADLKSGSLENSEDIFNDPYLQCPCLKHLHQVDQLSLSDLPSHPNVNECQLFQFIHHYVYEIALSLWTEQQFQSLHRAAALYLESQDRKCTNCGGGGYNLRPSQIINTVSDSETDDSPMSLSKPSAKHLSKYSPSNEGLELEESDQHNVQFSILDNIKLDFNNCECEESLVHIYPQLIHHWKSAGDISKTVYYLACTAEAALSTWNNMEAISILEEAQSIARGNNSAKLCKIEKSRLECLQGQAYFQSGELKICLPHFHKSLHLLGIHLCTTKPLLPFSLAWQATRQLLHVKFPHRWFASKHGPKSDNFLERAHCMSMIINAYHLKKERLKALLTALTQVNTAEEAQQNINRLVDSYAAMVKCCQLFDFKQLGESYFSKALTLCSSVKFEIGDFPTYANLLTVGLNLKLCMGKFSEAVKIGNVASWLTTKINYVQLKLAALPLLFYANLFELKADECSNIIEQLKRISNESEDLRAQAIIDCCKFEGLLDIGMKLDITELISSAQCSCQDEIFRFDNTDRFLLISCLSLWHCRIDDNVNGFKFMRSAKSLLPSKFESFFSIRGLIKFLECSLALYQKKPSSYCIKSQTKSVLGIFESQIKRYPVFKPQYLRLKSLYHYISKEKEEAMRLMKESLAEGENISCKIDCQKAQAILSEWDTTP